MEKGDWIAAGWCAIAIGLIWWAWEDLAKWFYSWRWLQELFT